MKRKNSKKQMKKNEKHTLLPKKPTRTTALLLPKCVSMFMCMLLSAILIVSATATATAPPLGIKKRKDQRERNSAIQNPNNNKNFQIKGQEHNFALYG
jgi:hypothetical protein